MGWLGNIFLIVGQWGVGDRRRASFLLLFAGEAIWFAYSCYLRMWDMAFICGVFSLIMLRNFSAWKKPESSPPGYDGEKFHGRDLYDLQVLLSEDRQVKVLTPQHEESLRRLLGFFYDLALLRSRGNRYKHYIETHWFNPSDIVDHIEEQHKP